MANPSPELISECRSLLLQCHEFESDRALRAFFKLNLYPFHLRLPEADNIASRVENCLGYLIDQRFPNGEWVLPMLILRLRDQYQVGDAIRDELDSLAGQLGAYMPAQNVIADNQKRRLKELLMQLNFNSQVKTVRKVVDDHKIAAFLIHGLPNYGQEVLVTRLSHINTGWDSSLHIPVDAGARGRGSSTHLLWREIAKRASIPSDTGSARLIEIICKWLETKNVIFIFHTIDYLPPQILNDLINEFWGPIVMAVRMQDNFPLLHHLILFMVDYRGIVCKSGVQFISQPTKIDDTYLPLLLPEVKPFPKKVLGDWLDTASDVLPSRISLRTLLETTQNGVPGLVYEKICAHCGTSWEGELSP